MSTSGNDLVESAMLLSPTARADLALRLLQSLAAPGEEITEKEFSQQLRDRVHNHRQNESTSVSLDEARTAVEKALSRKSDS